MLSSWKSRSELKSKLLIKLEKESEKLYSLARELQDLPLPEMVFLVGTWIGCRHLHVYSRCGAESAYCIGSTLPAIWLTGLASL
jgi:hypothetical protein